MLDKSNARARREIGPARDQAGGSIGLLATDKASWRSGYAAACKAVYTGSIPVDASEKTQ